MSDGATRVCLAVTSLMPGNGGIARVARLMAKVLGGEVAQGRLDLRTIGLYDRASASDLGVEVMPARGSRLRFTTAVQLAALGSRHFAYDSLAMARAHGRLPLLTRPRLAWAHGIEVWEGTRSDRIDVARGVDLLVANSDYTRARAEGAHGGFARARVCWLGTETDEPPTDAVRGDPPVVLILGRLEPGRDKGHEALIDVWPHVVSALPQARLLIVGTGPDHERLRALAAASPAASRIDIAGFVPEAAMAGVWQRTTVLAMPSRGEGFGLVYIEAMRHGVPVIASVHDAAPEINVEGETGYNIDLAHPRDLSDRLVDLLRDRDLCARLGAAGRRRWHEHFRFGAFRERFLPLVLDLLSLH